MFAAITRDDWGVDVDRRGRTSMIVRRGDHRTTRLWRILHELRHPAGNKRQAFRHTTGRRYVGRLRAHPSRLDEVTATVVPGERLHIEAEGGWGRHLPTVDDLLGLPWLRGSAGPEREVLIASSHGMTRLRLVGDLGQRLRARARLNLDYAALADLRRRALIADEPSERRRFTDELRARYQVDVSFEPHPGVVPGRPVPARLRALFERAGWARASAAVELEPEPEPEVVFELAERSETAKARASTALAPVVFAAPQVGEGLRAWLRDNLHYFLTLEGNSQAGARACSRSGSSGWFLGSGYADRRRKIAKARAAIPLSIGGWGTRGKSGTERLKAGLFHGLGFRTFVQDHRLRGHVHPLRAARSARSRSTPSDPTARPRSGSSATCSVLAAGLESEVFLWECMALNPEYVDILQRGWMRDDIATITNTYPDHEDIQGPAGIDVATVISALHPRAATWCISSELAFNPVLRDRPASAAPSSLEIGDHEGDLLADDLLALFPYSRAPAQHRAGHRARRASSGSTTSCAIVTMADYVVPRPRACSSSTREVAGPRPLARRSSTAARPTSAPGSSTTGRRTGCDELAAAAAADPGAHGHHRGQQPRRPCQPLRGVLADPGQRRERRRPCADRHQPGRALAVHRPRAGGFRRDHELVDADALAAGGLGHARARVRLRALLDRVRAPVDGWADALARLCELGLAALGRRLDPDGPSLEAVRRRVASLREDDGSLEFDAVVAVLRRDSALTKAVRALHDQAVSAPEPGPVRTPSSVARATLDDFVEHFRARVARMVIAARLSTKLERVLAERDPAALARFVATSTRAWTALFKAQLVFIWDAGASGDQIIECCARAVPPGVHVTIMGTQNIKGTGLDFIYRWQALDAVHAALAKLDLADEPARLEILRGLDAHADFGFTDTGLLVARLTAQTGGSAPEQALRAALLDKLGPIHRAKLRELDQAGADRSAGTRLGRLARSLEGWVDFVDGAVRHRQSQQLVDDLIDGRVSHNKMAVEMRELYARAKGGWLSKALSKRRKPARRKSG